MSFLRRCATVLFLGAACLCGQVASANDFASFGSLAGQMAGLARILNAHAGTVARYPSVSHSFFTPMQMAAFLGESLPRRARTPRTVLRAENDGFPALILEEIPAWVALFRGYVVDDEMARRFPSYVLSPSSRTFWVLDDSPGAQPKAFVHTVRVTDAADAASAPLVLQIAGNLGANERRLVSALVDRAHGQVPLFVGTGTNASAAIRDNLATAIFVPSASQRATRVRFPKDWPLLAGMDPGQRASMEAFDSPFQATQSRSVKLVTLEPSAEVRISVVEPTFDYVADVQFQSLPLWERALLAASLYQQRFYEPPTTGGTFFSMPLQFNRAEETATLLATDVPRGAPTNHGEGVVIPLAEIEDRFAVSDEQIIAANRVRAELRVYFRATAISGTLDPDMWRLAKKAGITEGDLYRLPRRALAESLLGLVRAGLVSRAQAERQAPTLWNRLSMEVQRAFQTPDETRLLESLAYLLPFLPEHFPSWYEHAERKTRGDSMNTLVNWAAKTGDVNFFKQVYDRVAADKRRESLHGAFAYACRTGEPAMMQHVRSLLGVVEADTLETGVQYATFRGRTGVAGALLREGAFRKSEPEVELGKSARGGYGATLLEILRERPQSSKEMNDLLHAALQASDPSALAALVTNYVFDADVLAEVRKQAHAEHRELHLRWLEPPATGEGSCGVHFVTPS